MYLTK